MVSKGADLVDLCRSVETRAPIDGWQPVDGEGLRSLGISPGVLDNHDLIGFDADLYRNANDQYVLAFHGADGATTSQYLMAIQLAGILASEVGPDHLVVTGRSLGGGLATVASIATGATAVTFDAPALSDPMVAYAATGSPLGLSPAQVADVRAELAAGQVRAIGAGVAEVCRRG